MLFWLLNSFFELTKACKVRGCYQALAQWFFTFVRDRPVIGEHSTFQFIQIRGWKFNGPWTVSILIIAPLQQKKWIINYSLHLSILSHLFSFQSLPWKSIWWQFSSGPKYSALLFKNKSVINLLLSKSYQQKCSYIKKCFTIVKCLLEMFAITLGHSSILALKLFLHHFTGHHLKYNSIVGLCLHPFTRSILN